MTSKKGTRFCQESVAHGVSTRLGDGTLLKQSFFGEENENLRNERHFVNPKLNAF
jgi:hypothetical protein